MNAKTVITLSIGTGAMLLLIFALMIKYKTRLWKSLPVSIILTVTGTIGTYVWFLIENSSFGGRSYYGAVFLVPIAFIYISKLMRIPYGDLMDFCAPAECVMLAIMKYQCLVDGCCGGRFLFLSSQGEEIFFPSQIVELVNAFIIMVFLMAMALSQKKRGKIYPWYLIIYGSTRFILNFFRADAAPLLLGLSAGSLWSLLAIFIGVLWITDRKIMIIKKHPTQE